VRSVRPRINDFSQKLPLLASLYDNVLMLRFTPAEWERVKDARVDIIGSVGVRLYRLGQTTNMPTTGSRDVPDLGRCTASIVEDRSSESVFKLLCESPRELPVANVRLTHGPSGREWKQGIHSVITYYSSGPYQTWFSPLNRGQAHFRLADQIPTYPGTQYLVPTEYLATAQLHITPEIPTGVALAHFQFQNLTIADYLIR
jgi:hypothetical protein